MSYTVSFTLKQHTPLIHFQAEQTGATIRATELKPKLDRFLIDRVFGGNAPQRYLIQGQDRALNYKVSIYYNGNNRIDEPKPYVKKGDNGYVAPYFADGVSIEHNKTIKVTFKSLDSELLEIIKRDFTKFLAIENFGARQSKGFGSYQDINIDKNEFERLLSSISPQVAYRVSSKGRNPKDALKQIDIFYRELKSGINYPNYKKSLLFKYMCDNRNGYGWEKRWIKSQFPSVVYGKHKPIDCTPPKEYRYIRALLGVAEHNEYYPKGQRNKLQIKIKSLGEGENKIDRFRSPITFKVFENNIYLIANEIDERLFNAEFSFTLNGKSHNIRTPDRFDLVNFLDSVRGIVRVGDRR